MTQHALVLTYFDFHGGRGEPARLALALGDIAFEDRRIPLAEWPKLKPQTPFGSIPLLDVDGVRLTQSNAINRFVGRLAGLYPENPWQAALCDEVMDVVEDASHALVATFGIKDPDELERAREKVADGPLTFFLTRVERLLEQRGGEYFADSRLTVADLKVFVWIRHLESGKLDHIPTDLAKRVAPALSAHRERVGSDPRVVAYYDARGGY